jgi:hypothetical protein
MAIEAILSFWVGVKYEKKSVSSINFRVSLKFFSIKELIALLKVFLSIYHKNDAFVALIEADLGEEYNRASSPNPSPEFKLFLTLPSISTAS